MNIQKFIWLFDRRNAGKLFFLSLLFHAGISQAQTTTVFSDAFNRSTVNPTSNPTLYTTTPSNGIISTTLNTGTDSALNLSNSTTALADRKLVTSPLTNFLAPFSSTLATNPGVITWSFNMKVGKQLSGSFGTAAAPTNASAVVLVSNSANLSTNTTTGYVVYQRGIANGTSNLGVSIQFAKFSQGLNSSGMTTLDSSLAVGNPTLANFTNWVSVKVTFRPSDSTWNFYVRDDGAVATPADPSNLTAVNSNLTSPMGTLVTTGTPNQYIRTAFTHFGFMWSHTGTANASTFAKYDNFSVTVEKPLLTLTPTSLGFPNTVVNTTSTTILKYKVNGSYLTSSPLIFTAPGNFTISKDSLGTYASSVTFYPASGSIVDSFVYVKFTPTTTGLISGNITNNKDAVKIVTVSGNGDLPPMNLSATELTKFPNTDVPNLSTTTRSFRITGSGLGAVLNVIAPDNFLVCTDSALFFSRGTLPITTNAGSLDTVVFVKYGPTGNSTIPDKYEDSIRFSIPNKYVKVSGYVGKFYYKGTSTGSFPLSTIANWSARQDGAGTQIPTDFNVDGVSYIIRNIPATDSLLMSTSSITAIGTSETVGKSALTTLSASIAYNAGIVFNATSQFVLDTVTVYPNGTGTITVALQNSNGTELVTTAPIAVSGSGGSTPVKVPLGITAKPGTGYRLVLKASTGITSLSQDIASLAFPYNSTSSNILLTSSIQSGATTTASYNYFFNIQLRAGGWIVGGNNSRIVLGSPQDKMMALTISSSKPILTVGGAVMDIDSAMNGNLGKRNILNINNRTTPVFGNLHDSSEVHCQNAAIDIVSTNTSFGRLFVDKTGGSVAFKSGNLFIKSLFQIDFPSQMNIPNSDTPYFVIKAGAKVRINSIFKFNNSVGFVSSNIANPSGIGTQIQFQGNEDLYLGPLSNIEYGRSTSSIINTQNITPRSDYQKLSFSGANSTKILSGNLICDTMYIKTTKNLGNTKIMFGAGDVTVGAMYFGDTVSLSGTNLTINKKIKDTTSNSRGVFLSNNTSNLTLSDSSGLLRFGLGGRVIKNLTLKTGASATLNDSLNITAGSDPGTLTVQSGATFNTGDKLILKSDSLGTARAGSTAGTINGNAILERYITAKRAWRLLSMPTQHNLQTIRQAFQEGGNNTISGYGIQLTSERSSWSADGFDAFSTAPSIKSYNPSTNLWEGLISTQSVTTPNASTGKFELGKAYMTFIRGDRSVTQLSQAPNPTILREKGNLVTGSYSLTGTAVRDSQFIAVGNPYASAVDFRKLSKTNIRSFYYLWDPKMSTYGAYQTIQLVGNSIFCSACGPGSSYTGTDYNVQSGQGFFVMSAGTGAYNLTFADSSKVAGSNLVSRNPNEWKTFTTSLYRIINDEKIKVDGSMHILDDSFSNEVNEQDASKINNLNENISVIRNGQSIAIETRNDFTLQDTIQYKTNQLKIANYQLVFTPNLLSSQNLLAYLEDSYLNSRTLISFTDSTQLNFLVNTDAGSYDPLRFRIVFSTANPLPVRSITLKATKNKEAIDINWQVQQEMNLINYEVERSADGIHFSKIGQVSATGGMNYSYSDKDPLSKHNYYRIRINNMDGSIELSKVVHVLNQSAEATISIYPIPVPADRKMNLNLSDIHASGDFQLTINDCNGRSILSQNIQITDNIKEYKISLPLNISAGIYFLTLQQNDIRIHKKVVFK